MARSSWPSRPVACRGDSRRAGLGGGLSELVQRLKGPNADALVVYNAAVPVLCPADTNGSGAVDVDDLIAVILAWGPCPRSTVMLIVFRRIAL